MDAEWLGPAVIAAVVSSLLGWVVPTAAWFGRFRRNLESRRERDQRVRDLQRALLAEIKSEVSRLETHDLDTHALDVERRIRSTGRAYAPWIPRQTRTPLLERLMSEVQILPSPIIEPVVRYYRQLVVVGNFVDDMRDERIITLDEERRVEIYRDYIGMVKLALVLAKETQSSIETELSEHR